MKKGLSHSQNLQNFPIFALIQKYSIILKNNFFESTIKVLSTNFNFITNRLIINFEKTFLNEKVQLLKNYENIPFLNKKLFMKRPIMLIAFFKFQHILYSIQSMSCMDGYQDTEKMIYKLFFGRKKNIKCHNPMIYFSSIKIDAFQMNIKRVEYHSNILWSGKSQDFISINLSSLGLPDWEFSHKKGISFVDGLDYDYDVFLSKNFNILVSIQLNLFEFKICKVRTFFQKINNKNEVVLYADIFFQEKENHLIIGQLKLCGY